MRARIRAVTLLVVAAAVLTGCTDTGANGFTGNDRDTGIRVWLVGGDVPTAARNYLVSAFEEQNLNARIVIEEQPWAGLIERIKADLASADGPDVVEMWKHASSRAHCCRCPC